MKFILFSFFIIFSFQVSAALKVVTTTPDLAWAIEQIGGNLVEVESLLRGTEDPHYVDAVPSFIHKVRGADLLCAVGLELESGWLPKVKGRSGARSKPYCEFGKGIRPIGVPKGKIDRSMGDVHASGNPHFHLSPTYLARGAKQALIELQGLLPDKTLDLQKSYNEFLQKMEGLEEEIKAELEPLQGKKFLQYHKEFSYYFKSYNLNGIEALENVPGVAPSASRLAQLSLELKDQNVTLVLAAQHAPLATLERFESLSKVPFLRLPLGMVKGEHESYFDLQKKLASEILKHAK